VSTSTLIVVAIVPGDVKVHLNVVVAAVNVAASSRLVPPVPRLRRRWCGFGEDELGSLSLRLDRMGGLTGRAAVCHVEGAP
jgi:hypothetical protein